MIEKVWRVETKATVRVVTWRVTVSPETDRILVSGSTVTVAVFGHFSRLHIQRCIHTLGQGFIDVVHFEQAAVIIVKKFYFIGWPASKFEYLPGGTIPSSSATIVPSYHTQLSSVLNRLAPIAK